MPQFIVPTIEDVTEDNREIFEKLETTYGVIPNIFAAFASSKNGLKSYFQFLQVANSLTQQENEVVNLSVSQVNRCPYCLSFHTVLAKKAGFTEDQISMIRANDIRFDRKLDALAKLTHNIAITKGSIQGAILEEFYEAGYDQGHLVDVVLGIGNITTLNLLYAITNVPIDFPMSKP